MKRFACLLALVVFAFVMVVGLSAASNEVKGGKLEQIIQSGTLRAGIILGGPPIGGRDDKGQPYGYDVDFAKKMASVLGVELEIVEVAGDTRIAMLTSGRVDILFANITGNLERAKSINFSIPYLKVGVKMLVKKGSAFNVIGDLNKKGIKIAVSRGSTNEALVKELAPLAERVPMDSYPNMVLSVKQGKVSACFEDSTIIDFSAGKDPELYSPPTVYTSDPICVGLAKGDPEFLRWVDMFISWMISSGWQAETYAKHWGTKPSDNLVHPW